MRNRKSRLGDERAEVFSFGRQIDFLQQLEAF